MSKNNVLKTKKLSDIMYNQGYVCINSSCLISANLIKLDDSLLQDKLNKDESFNFNVKTKSFNDKIPKLLEIIPKDITNYTELENTGLKTCKGKTYIDIFYNPIIKRFVYFTSEYLKIFTDSGLDLRLSQSDNKLSVAIVLDNNNKCQFLIMPYLINDCYLDKFEYSMNE